VLVSKILPRVALYPGRLHVEGLDQQKCAVLFTQAESKPRMISATYQPQKRLPRKLEHGAVISQLLGLEIQFLHGGGDGIAEVEVIEATRMETRRVEKRAISILRCFSYELES